MKSQNDCNEIHDDYYRIKLEINSQETLQFVKEYLQWIEFAENVPSTGGFMRYGLWQTISDVLVTQEGDYFLLEYNHNKK